MIKRWDRTVTSLVAALCLYPACMGGQASADSPPVDPAVKTLRVLILSGPGGHDWCATTSFLRQVLSDTGRFDVRVCESPAGLNARTLRDFDVLVDASGASASRNNPEGEIARFVDSGKGLVVTYEALVASTSTHKLDGVKGPAGEGAGKVVRECWPAVAAGRRAPGRPFPGGENRPARTRDQAGHADPVPDSRRASWRHGRSTLGPR